MLGNWSYWQSIVVAGFGGSRKPQSRKINSLECGYLSNRPTDWRRARSSPHIDFIGGKA